MKTIRFGLLPRILTAILLGILCGLFFPLPLVRAFTTFNSIFSNLLGFFIPIIILGLVTPAIAEIGKGAGKLLLVTVAIAYLDTIFSGCLSYATSVSIFPKLIDGSQAIDVSDMTTGTEPYFNIATAKLNQALELDRRNQPRVYRTQIRKLYMEARPYMEAYRKLAPDEKRKWAPALYRIYLNLNMGKQFDEIDRVMKTL